MFERIEQRGEYVYIRGLNSSLVSKHLKILYDSSKIAKLFEETYFTFFGRESKIHYFFIPELIYIFNKLYDTFKRPIYNKMINLLYDNTWAYSLNLANNIQLDTKLNLSKLSDLSFELKPYQLEFIQKYPIYKDRLQLRGYILAFTMGLGKTLTSTALMHCLNKDLTIIIAPKSTLRDVWKNEINKYFKDKKNIYVIGDKEINKDTEYIIFNYESIDKILPIVSYLSHKKNIGLIIDESHNFKTYGNKRVSSVLHLVKSININDIILSSGTPIKALGGELVPALSILDNKFDDIAREKFTKIFGVSVPIAADIVKNRLSLMMHRKLTSDVLNLPEKHYHTIFIKLSNGHLFTLSAIKKEMLEYIDQRFKFYKLDINKYQDEYNRILNNFITQYPEYKKYYFLYKKITTMLNKGEIDIRYMAKEDREYIKKFETTILEPKLNSSDRKSFRHVKSIYKYLYLKIFGEALGNVLTKRRQEMYSEMIKQSSKTISNIINDSEKKTVLFTTYVDVLKMTNQELSKHKFETLTIFGENVSSRDENLQLFKEDPTKNPLIATIQTLSTGVTLNEANTIIFINSPWRSVDKIQAESRCHRIGQDTDVHIYTMVLDTGNEGNLSTRLEDIVNWSQEMFKSIVGDGEDVSTKLTIESTIPLLEQQNFKSLNKIFKNYIWKNNYYR